MPANTALSLQPTDSLVTLLDRWVADHPDTSGHCYGLADAGQDRAAWRRLAHQCLGSKALLSAAEDLIPHLLDFGPAGNLSAELLAALSRKHAPGAFTMLCSSLSLVELHAHLCRFVDVKLPDNHEMLLAFWDPAILGTLLGQTDDVTLHVAGPVFQLQQREVLLRPIAAWWYCDREGYWHRIDAAKEKEAELDELVLPLKLTQEQEDALVEAGVPDQVLYHLELNRPSLFDEYLSHAKRYRFVREVLPSARKLGLEGMRDLANFVSLCLIYRQRIETDPQILLLLDLVQQKKLTLDEALKEMPE